MRPATTFALACALTIAPTATVLGAPEQTQPGPGQGRGRGGAGAEFAGPPQSPNDVPTVEVIA